MIQGEENIAEVVDKCLYDNMAKALNKILEADPTFVATLFSFSVQVNNCGDDNPLVCRALPNGLFVSSALGVINTLFFSERYRIQVHFDDKDPTGTVITKFSVRDCKAGKIHDDRPAGLCGRQGGPEARALPNSL